MLRAAEYCSLALLLAYVAPTSPLLSVVWPFTRELTALPVTTSLRTPRARSVASPCSACSVRVYRVHAQAWFGAVVLPIECALPSAPAYIDSCARSSAVPLRRNLSSCRAVGCLRDPSSMFTTAATERRHCLALRRPVFLPACNGTRKWFCHSGALLNGHAIRRPPSGCSGWESDMSGAIALASRGNCTFVHKARRVRTLGSDLQLA